MLDGLVTKTSRILRTELGVKQITKLVKGHLAVSLSFLFVLFFPKALPHDGAG